MEETTYSGTVIFKIPNLFEEKIRQIFALTPSFSIVGGAALELYKHQSLFNVCSDIDIALTFSEENAQLKEEAFNKVHNLFLGNRLLDSKVQTKYFGGYNLLKLRSVDALEDFDLSICQIALCKIEDCGNGTIKGTFIFTDAFSEGELARKIFVMNRKTPRSTTSRLLKYVGRYKYEMSEAFGDYTLRELCVKTTQMNDDYE